MYSTLELVALCLAAPLVAIVILKAVDACVRLYRRVGRYRYNTLTSDAGSSVDDAAAAGCAEDPIVVGVGVCTTNVAVLPIASPHVRQQLQKQQPLVDIGYDSLKGVEENVVKEMKRTNSCNGGSSGDTSISSTTQSDESMERQRQRQQLPPDQVSTVTIDHVGGAHAHKNDDDQQPNTTTSSAFVVTPSSNTAITTTMITTGGGVEIDHRRGRPNMEDFLTELFATSESPGIFMCGPALLLNAVKDVVLRNRCGGRCANRGVNGRRGDQHSTVLPRCAIYEEGFEV